MTRPTTLALIAALCATGAQAFDRAATAAMQACHDRLWSVPEFDGLPNAAITVFPGMMDASTIMVNWIVTWDEPAVRAAGTCTVTGGTVTEIDDYTK